jgi:type IX secretion system PorP/SprF family membrane protein
MKKVLLILSIVLTAYHHVFAQQDAQMSQYMFNQFYFNPSTAGLNPKWMEANVTYRMQWANYAASFDKGGSPTTLFASFNMPLRIANGGVGLIVKNDKIGPLTNFNLSLNYAYHKAIRNGTFSVGVKGGLYNLSVDFDMLRAREPNDPLIPTGSLSQFKPDFGLGAYINKKKYFTGLAWNHLVRSQYDFGTSPTKSRLNTHMNLIGGLNFDLGSFATLTPSAMILTDFNSLSYQISGIATFQQKFYGGVSLRNSNAIDDAVLLVGVNLMDNRLRLGYAFDYVVSGRVAKAATSHEITLTWRMPAPMPFIPPVIRTPRFRY